MNLKRLIILSPPKKAQQRNLKTDATSLKEIESNSIESLSALCSLEHFGLGRYGDPIDPEGTFKAFKSFQRVLKKGGNVYISVPVDDSDYISFNGARVMTPKTVVETFNELTLVEFSCVTKNGTIRNLDFSDFNAKNISESSLTGLYHFQK